MIAVKDSVLVRRYQAATSLMILLDYVNSVTEDTDSLWISSIACALSTTR